MAALMALFLVLDVAQKWALEITGFAQQLHHPVPMAAMAWAVVGGCATHTHTHYHLKHA